MCNNTPSNVNMVKTQNPSTAQLPPKPLIDLHMHTTVSDGTDSPAKLVKMATSKGLAAIAVTDHDTVAGIASALSEAESSELEIVPGVEFSAHFQPVMHILGLFIDINNKLLAYEFNKLTKARMRIISKSFKNANNYGINVTPAQVLERKNRLSITNLIEFLLENSLIKNQNEANDLFASIWDEWRNCLPSPAECISYIHSSNGLAILAHPKLLHLDDVQLKKLMIQLKNIGLDGIEVIHPDHTNEDKIKFMKWADELGLLYSGGSDYHGKKMRNEVASDENSAGIIVPYSYLEAMKERLKKR